MFSEFRKERLVEEVLDIFVVVEGSGGGRSLVGSFLVGRFTRVDTWLSVPVFRHNLARQRIALTFQDT